MEPALNYKSAKRLNGRRRAAKACIRCRRRKVRCDVTRSPSGCTNCRLDGVECSTVEEEKAMSETSSEAQGRVRHSISRLEHFVQEENHYTVPKDAISPQNGYVSDTFMMEALEMITKNNPIAHLQDVGEEGQLFPLAPQTSDDTQTLRPWVSLTFESEPLFRISYLKAEGCFEIPNEPILRQFLRLYFLFVNPMLPMIDENLFWDRLSLYGSAGNYSLRGPSILLLQAMLFASSPYVPEEAIYQLGYSDIAAARACFYRKAKYLYESYSIPENESMAQACLLLTYWCPPGDRANSDWLQLAIRHAKSINAHNYTHTSPTSNGLITEQEPHSGSLKRIWWCCVIRDRIMPVCMRRSIQIRRKDFDFATHPPLNTEDLEENDNGSKVYSVDEGNSIAAITSLMIQFCVCLTDILELVYPEAQWFFGDSEAVLDRLLKAKENRQALDNWLQIAITASLEFATVGDANADNHLFSESSQVFANLLWIYYHTAAIALTSYELQLVMMGFLRVPTNFPRFDFRMVDGLLEGIHSHSVCITERLRQLLNQDLARWLPSSAVGCTALPLALHMLRLKFSSPTSGPVPLGTPNSETQARLNTLIQAMKEYHPRHEGAAWVSKIIRYFMECTYLEEPGSTSWVNWDPFLLDLSRSLKRATPQASLISCQPTNLLRLALTIDLALSNGCLPEEGDFPPILRALFSRTGCFMPIIWGQQNDTMMRGTARRKDRVQTMRTRSTTAQSSEGVSGWIENDRSLYFALEMGLGPSEVV